MTTFKPPKPYKLTKTETIASFEAWKHNQLYNIQQDPVLRAFIAKTKTWRKASTADRMRGLTDDNAEAEVRKTAAEKLLTLNL